MPWNMSNYLEGQILTHLFRSTSFAKPSTLAVALCSGTVLESDTGVTIQTGKELANAGGYARQQLPPNDTNWGTPTQDANNSGWLGNNSAITFGPFTAAHVGTVVTHLAILDSGTWGSGNLLYAGPLSANQTISLNATLSLPISGLAIFAD